MDMKRFVLSAAILTVLPVCSAFGQLADSSWPSFHGGSSNSGYTPIVAKFGQIAWTVAGGAPGYESAVEGSPVVGSDGTVYTAAVGGIMAVSPDGKKLFGGGAMTGRFAPAVDRDGTVYYSDYGWSGGRTLLYAMNPDGTQRWSSYTDFVGIDSAPIVDSKGNLYVAGSFFNGHGNEQSLSSYDAATGQMRWHVPVGTWPAAASGLAIGIDDTVYMTSGQNLHAFSASGTQLWQSNVGDTSYYGSPTIGPDGTIYCGSVGEGSPKGLCATKPNGDRKWFAEMSGGPIGASAVGPDGHIYTLGAGGLLWAHDANGGLLWKYSIPDIKDAYRNSPVIDGAGLIYFTATGSDSKSNYLLAVNSVDGTERGRMSVGYVSESVAIGPNGQIYLGAGYLQCVVPEPSCLFALMGGAGALLIRARRRG